MEDIYEKLSEYILVLKDGLESTTDANNRLIHKQPENKEVLTCFA